jgi:Transposase, Mutator family
MADVTMPGMDVIREQLVERNADLLRECANTIRLQIPKLREGSYHPRRLPEPRSRSQRTLVSVVADMYPAGSAAWPRTWTSCGGPPYPPARLLQLPVSDARRAGRPGQSGRADL